jgi:hypothetical protein
MNESYINTNAMTRIFVMMQFSNKFKSVRESIRKSASTAGFFCVWADELYHVGKITEQIESEIKSAHICICDVTNKNPNVAWEYGYAMALGKKVILLSQNAKYLFFDIKDNRTIIYDPLNIDETLIQPLIISLGLIKSSLSNIAPELLIGTKNHERMKLVATAKNIADTPYGIFNLISAAKEHIFIAGQNLYYFLQSNSNKSIFRTELKKFLKRSPNGQIDIMMCDENCSYAIQTWEYAQNITRFREQLEEVIFFFKEVSTEFNKESSLKGRLTIKKFDFIPVSASFIDPRNENGLAVIIPSAFQKINDARPCYILSNTYNKEILHEYWSVYYFWFTSMPSETI